MARARAMPDQLRTELDYNPGRPMNMPRGSVLRYIEPVIDGENPKEGAALVFYDNSHMGIKLAHDPLFWIMNLSQADKYQRAPIKATRVAHLDINNPSDLQLIWDIIKNDDS